MSLASLAVSPGYLATNDQKTTKIIGTLVVSGTVYEVGGIPLDAVLLALPEATTNSGILYCRMCDNSGQGYIFQRIPSTGTMMILQVPPSGSLTTAAPLQQLPSSTNLGNLFQNIGFEAVVKRNA